MNKNINFDDYAKSYVNITQKKLNFFNNTRDYFDSYKVNITKKIFKNPNKILDYGCGIGLCLPHLKNAFPHSAIYGTDLSLESLKIAKSYNPFLNLINTSNLKDHKFDLIFISGVFHHIHKSERNKVFAEFNDLLKDDGGIIIFEHNPYNFITRKLVSECPYDEGVELIYFNEMKSYFKKNIINILDSGYTLFFPSFLKYLRRYDYLLKKLYLGGQYYIAGKKVK